MLGTMPGTRMQFRGWLWILTTAALLVLVGPAAWAGPGRPMAFPTPTGLEVPILFVTQVPIPADFTTITSVFGNHLSDLESAGRGGDLYLLDPDGTLRNLTAEAGFGMAGRQGAGAIAVRDPAVHWDGEKAVFSMVMGAPERQYQVVESYWQLYEVTGLGPGQRAVITRVAGQPERYNNVSPVYGSQDQILFVSDRPRGGQRHLYPQLDEYETAPTNTGVWSLDVTTGALQLLDHAPSGAFDPIVDSFGRVIFTRWDHLQRDQQADSDALEGGGYGTFDFADESAEARRLPRQEEVFPEPRDGRPDLLQGTPFEGHRFNHFFPWMMNQDGTELETLNHVGRHELHGYFNRSRHDDPNLVEHIGEGSGRFNRYEIENLLQIQEDPIVPGRYFGIDAPEFQTHGAGQILFVDAPPGLVADSLAVTYITARETRSVTGEGESPEPGHVGLFRDPLPLVNGRLIAVHTAETRADHNEGSRQRPRSRYDFRLRLVQLQGGQARPGRALTPGIRKQLSYWDPDVLVEVDGPLWELSPVEVRRRPRPPAPASFLAPPEAAIFAEEGVDPEAFREALRGQGLALLVGRNVTSRDAADRQQPFNLRVPGGVQSRGAGGTVYEVSHLQLFLGLQVRGIGGIDSPRPGRRLLARPWAAATSAQGADPQGPAGGIRIASDGSFAALVPAHRATTWQLTAPQGAPVVRERYWLTFQSGELRVCPACHGVNSRDQRGAPAPEQPPAALRAFLRAWKGGQGTNDGAASRMRSIPVAFPEGPP
jgi:hypothetical protein